MVHHIYILLKGAKNLVDIDILEDGLKNLSKIIKQKYKVDISKVIGGGAAGGCGAGLYGILNATISSGFSLLSKIVELKKIKCSDLVITGEGKSIVSLSMVKFHFQVAKIANKYNIPVICLSGSIDRKKLKKFEDIGFSRFIFNSK